MWVRSASLCPPAPARDAMPPLPRLGDSLEGRGRGHRRAPPASAARRRTLDPARCAAAPSRQLPALLRAHRLLRHVDPDPGTSPTKGQKRKCGAGQGSPPGPPTGVWLCDSRRERRDVGEQLGFEAFYAATYRRVVGQVFALLNDLQEARGRDPERPPRPRSTGSALPPSQPEAWVRRVAFNEAYNSTRRARRWRGTGPSRPAAPVPAVSPDRVDLHHALQRLSLRHRGVLVLHYGRLPVDEVARQLRLPAGRSRAASAARRASPTRSATSARE